MSLLEQLAQSLTSQQNQWLFAVRSLLKPSKGAYEERPEPKLELFLDRQNPAYWEAEAERLLATYKIRGFAKRATRQRYLEALTCLSHLEIFDQKAPVIHPDHVLRATAQQPLRWLDVGAKNWAYVPALYGMLHKTGAPFDLTGVEIDGYRQYTDGHYRYEYAQAYIEQLGSDYPVRYEVGDILNWDLQAHASQYHVISCFLPFVFLDPCLAWGLPAQYFRPEYFFKHLLRMLTDNGTLILVNQDIDEADEQVRLLKLVQQECSEEFEFEIDGLGQLPDSFMQFQYPRFGWRVQKHAKVSHPSFKDPQTEEAELMSIADQELVELRAQYDAAHGLSLAASLNQHDPQPHDPKTFIDDLDCIREPQ